MKWGIFIDGEYEESHDTREAAEAQVEPIKDMFDTLDRPFPKTVEVREVPDDYDGDD